MNADRIAKANYEGEVWRVVNDIIKLKSNTPITINTGNEEPTKDQDVAEKLNKHIHSFIQRATLNFYKFFNFNCN